MGRRTTWLGGPFPARWAGLGERLARWAGSWFGVRGPTVRTKSRLRPTKPARRERGPLWPPAGHSSGDHRPDGQRTNLDRLGPRPLGVHPSPPSAWVQRQGGGGADLRVRSAGHSSGDNRGEGQANDLDRPGPAAGGGVRIAPCTGNPLGVRVVCHPEEPRGSFALTPRPEAERVEQERVEGEIREAEETARKKWPFRPHPSPLPRARGLFLA